MTPDYLLINDGDALSETCLIEIPANSESTADQYGLGTWRTALMLVSPCLLIPPRETVDRMTGLVVKQPLSLLVRDERGIVTASCRITHRGIVYKIQQRELMDEHDSLVKLTVEREL